jgi:hypothetical protein
MTILTHILNSDRGEEEEERESEREREGGYQVTSGMDTRIVVPLQQPKAAFSIPSKLVTILQSIVCLCCLNLVWARVVGRKRETRRETNRGKETGRQRASERERVAAIDQ